MATRNIVPRATGEGSIGTSAKTWNAVYTENLSVTNEIQGIASGNLPLSGGTMEGTIVSSVEPIISNNTDDGTVFIYGGTEMNRGARIGLNGKDNSFVAGAFTITATDGTNTKQFQGKPDGTLTWDGNNVLTDKVTSVNSLSSSISFESGFSLRGGNLRIVGGVFAKLRLGVNISTSISANTSHSVGTITNAKYCPAVDSAFGGGDENLVTIGANGTITIRFLTAKGSGSWIWLESLYLLV